MKNLKLSLAASAFALIAGTPAHAATLLDLINPPGQSNTPISLSFFATGPSVTLSVEGYQVPDSLTVTSNTLTGDNNSINILANTWDYTRALSGGNAGQFNDGTSVNGLLFAGLTVGSYDVFSQTFAATAGNSYTYSFLFNNSSLSEPSGLRVLADNASLAAGVPEPSTWAMMILGFGLIGFVLRKRSNVSTTVSYA